MPSVAHLNTPLQGRALRLPFKLSSGRFQWGLSEPHWPRTIQGLQSKAAAACKPTYQRPHPKPLLTLKMLQTSRSLQTQQRKKG